MTCPGDLLREPARLHRPTLGLASSRDQSPWAAHAEVVHVPRKSTSRPKSTGEGGKLAVLGLMVRRSFAELLEGIRHKPAIPKLSHAHVDAACRAWSLPLEGAGVGRGHMAQRCGGSPRAPGVRWQLEPPCLLGACEGKRTRFRVGGPAGELGAGAGGKMGVCRRWPFHGGGHLPTLYR